MTIEAELHDGRVLEFPDGTDPSVVQATVKKMLSPEAKTTAPKAGGWANALASPDAMLSLGSGAVAAPISGLAGIAGTILPGPEGQGSNWVRKVQEALTVSPKTTLGSGITRVASLPGELLARAGDAAGTKVSDVAGPAAGAATNAVIQASPLALGLRKSGPRELSPAAKNAREAGFSLTPEDLGAGSVAKNVAGLAGEPKLAKLISMNNRETANALIAEDFGIPKDTKISRETLENIREQQGSNYEIVRKSGTVALDGPLKKEVYDSAKDLLVAARELPYRAENPLLKTVKTILSRDKLDANTMVSEIINLRAEAKKAFASKDAGAGRVDLAIAEAMEGALDRHLSKPTMGSDMAGVPGDTGALQRLRDSRTVIAKTYAADRAMNPATGDFNPQAYAHMLRQKVPLTGGPKQVAEAAAAFPRSLQNPTGLPPSGASYFDLFLGRGLGLPIAGDVMSVMARPGVRNSMASQEGQKLLTGETQLTPGLLQMIAASQAQHKQ